MGFEMEFNLNMNDENEAEIFLNDNPDVSREELGLSEIKTIPESDNIVDIEALSQIEWGKIFG